MIKMKLFVIVLSTFLITLTAGQNLVLIGGNLRDDNDVVWNTIIGLAVSLHLFSFPFVQVSRTILLNREGKVQPKSGSSRPRNSTQ